MRKSLRSGMMVMLLPLVVQARSLTMRQCVDEAIATHPDVKSALLRVESRRQDLQSAASGLKPQISLSASYNPQQTYVMPLNGKLNTSNDSGWVVDISLQQKLFDFSRTFERMQSARSRKQIARLSLQEARALLRYRVRTAYLTLLSEKAALSARRKDLEAKRASYRQAEALVNQGLKTRADLFRFRAAMRQAEAALAQEKSAYEKARYLLESYMGRTLGSPLSLRWPRRPESPGKPTDAIVSSNPRLKMADSDLAAAQADARAAQAERYGEFQLVAEHRRVGSREETYNDDTLGVRYSLPLYQGGRLAAQSQKARVEAMIAAQSRESTRRALRTEVQSIFADLRQLEVQERSAREQLVAARESLRLLQARYAQGLSTYMEILDAQALALDARMSLIATRQLQWERNYRLEYLDGK